jgi:hypothetical protein
MRVDTVALSERMRNIVPSLRLEENMAVLKTPLGSIVRQPVLWILHVRYYSWMKLFNTHLELMQIVVIAHTTGQNEELSGRVAPLVPLFVNPINGGTSPRSGRRMMDVGGAEDKDI